MDRTQQLATIGWVAFIFLDVAYLAYYLCGKLVDWFHTRVNYTRKVMHFVTFGLPWALQQAFNLENNVRAAFFAALLAPLHLLLFAEPIRRRSEIVATMFRGIDRPEDRPYTLWWMLSQYFATYTAYAFIYVAMIYRDVTNWMLVPLLVMAIGDGLAEPIGVRFGKHPYLTTPLNGTRPYRRTWEGSACVFLTAAVVLPACYSWFTPPQFLVALVVIPISATLLEAKSPHTWDQPFLLLGLGLELLAISYV